MIISFTVSNFRSIQNSATLAMTQNRSIKDSEDAVIDQPIGSTHPLLRTAVIYGLNGTGKTNLLLAINRMREIIVYGHRSTDGDHIKVEPFLLSEEINEKPTSFKIAFVVDGIKYDYEFSVTRTRVVHENLIAFPNNVKQNWFIRNYNSKNDRYDWKFGTNFKGERKSIKNRTLQNVLYLSKAAQDNHELIKPIIKFFRQHLNVIFSENNTSFYTTKMLADPNRKGKLMHFLNDLDLGFEDINIESEAISEDILKLAEHIPEKTRELLAGQQILKAKSVHSIPGTEKTIEFDFSEHESVGTQQAFSLAGPIVDILQNGGVLVVDELETSLHIKLFQRIIKYFNDGNYNKRDAQLIFSTHTPAAVDAIDFRRDQIWFTDKTESARTILYSLADLKKVRKDLKSVRKGQKISKGILEGAFYTPPKYEEEQLTLFDL